MLRMKYREIFKKITSSWIQNIDDKKYLIESNSIFSEYFVSIFQKLIDNLSFQIINLIILILYRTGYKGEFLGVGGTWNLNEDKNPDAEMVASGVLVGFFIYTSVVLISYCFGSMYHKKTLVVRSIFINFKNEKKICCIGLLREYKYFYRSKINFHSCVKKIIRMC